MYTAGSLGALAVTPGATYATTGSLVAAGVALVGIGAALMIAARLRRRHDDRATEA